MITVVKTITNVLKLLTWLTLVVWTLCVLFWWGNVGTSNVMQQASAAAMAASLLVAGYVLARGVVEIAGCIQSLAFTWIGDDDAD